MAAAGTDQSNTAPTADFTVDCTDLTCTFTDASTDTRRQRRRPSRGTSAIRRPARQLRDRRPPQTPHTFSGAGTFNVTVTATDNDGATSHEDHAVTVTAPSPGGPSAAFDVTCAA